MPATRISPDLEMHYLIDDYTDPWREAETVLLLHGNGESDAAWFAWVPHLARRFRVVRPDMRGFGPRSTLLVLPGDSFHVAASDPDRCARETLDFISRVGAVWK